MKKTIDATPQAFEIDTDHTALWVIDVQPDFFERGGFADVGQGLDVRWVQPILPSIREIVELARTSGIQIIFTREAYQPDLSDVPEPWLKAPENARIGSRGKENQGKWRFLIDGERGTELMIETKPEDIILRKASKDAFVRPSIGNRRIDLLKKLRRLGLRQFLFTGATSGVCGASTISRSSDEGFESGIITDLMADYDHGIHAAAMKNAGGRDQKWPWISACLTTSEAVKRALAA
ncbi:MAG TPA: isochorismatase family protein [Candidatus Peribacterales bacterium]|nr:isochorismatase family protein [Candidatus Peribacterales bacterium]